MRIAVTGATGRLGKQIVETLAATGEHQVVAVARTAPNVTSAHVVAARADYADPAALRAAFVGADTLVLVSSDGEAVTVLHHHQNVIQAARDAGVGFIVALSGLDADLDSPFCYAVTNGYTERLLRDSECPVTIVRASIYTEFFLDLLTTAADTSGAIRLPAGDGAVSLVSRADVGRCLAALALAWPANATHEITGPEALDLHAVAARCAQRWQQPVRYVDISPADYQIELTRHGTEPWWNYAFTTMFDSIRQHRWQRVSDDVQRLTHQPPRALLDALR
jgi:NAD(P)H dehydrogenase (quinone)